MAIKSTQIRITLYGIMLAGMLLVTFGSGNSLPASAQQASITSSSHLEKTVATPLTGVSTSLQGLQNDIIIDFDTVISVPDYLRQAIRQSVIERSSILPKDTFFYATAFRISNDGDWARIVLVPSYVIESGWENLVIDDVVEILAHRQNLAAWDMQFYEDEGFYNLARNAPDDFIDLSLASAVGHRFPWTSGQSWWKNGGWHTGYYSLENNAIDFQPKSTTSSNLAVLAAAPGVLDSLCGPDANGQMWLKITNADGTAGYGHLSSSTVRTDLLGKSVVIGQYLGNLYHTGGSFNTPCGSGTATHLHFVFPNRNVTMYDVASSRDVSANEMGNYTNPGVVSYTSNNTRVDNPSSCDATSVPSGYSKCADENGYCSFSGTKSVYYGANSCYRVKSYSNGITCDNNNFSPDPVPGTQKACYIESTPPSCNPNADQIALYADSNYGGSCVVKGIGNYPNPSSLGIANDRGIAQKSR